MDNLSDCSIDVIEFVTYNQGKLTTKFAEISIATDPLPELLHKSIETNRTCNVETQSEAICSSTANVDERKLAQWLKTVCPLMEAELRKGLTPVPASGILNSTEDEEDPTIQTYQKIHIPSKENIQGLATWLSIYASNTPVLVLTASAAHDDWCEHVDQNIKIYIPQRIQSGSFIVFQELKSLPTKACLITLSTNPFDKDLFIGSTVSGDLYVWKFISNKNHGDVVELFCETLQQGSAVAFDWPSENKLLTCHANGWVCLWELNKFLIKKADFFVRNDSKVDLELTTIVSVSTSDFVVGCANGILCHCVRSNVSSSKNGIEITPMRSHNFAVTSLIKKDIAGRRLIISCDLTGEVFFHDLVSSDEDGVKVILRIPLPFQNNIACSKDGKVIFCPGNDGSLEIYRITNGKQSNVKGGLRGRGNMIKLSENNSWIVTGLYGNDFQIFCCADY